MTAANTTQLLQLASEYVTDFFSRNMSVKYVFHDYQHTCNVVLAARQIGERCRLSEEELNLLQIAAWFHDTGYDQGMEGHEARSCTYARAFMTGHGCDEAAIRQVEGCIMATKMPQTPHNLMEQALADADMSHLGKKSYWDRCERIRKELELTRGVAMNDETWVDFEIRFMDGHRYHTLAANAMFEERKQKHIRQLNELRDSIAKQSEGDINDLADRTVVTKEKEKEKTSRGVETMFRTTYRTHINLSTSADNKAHIMLSINTIVISLAVSNLVHRLGDYPKFVIPTAVLLTVCLTSMVYATLATRPKITEGKVTREAIQQRKANLLFFGNFYNMKLEDFHWGMMEMLKDNDFLYSSMTRDLYFLGVVLGKKYRYLTICYNVFMYGFIAAVMCFALALLF